VGLRQSADGKLKNNMPQNNSDNIRLILTLKSMSPAEREQSVIDQLKAILQDEAPKSDEGIPASPAPSSPTRRQLASHWYSFLGRSADMNMPQKSVLGTALVIVVAMWLVPPWTARHPGASVASFTFPAHEKGLGYAPLWNIPEKETLAEYGWEANPDSLHRYLNQMGYDRMWNVEINFGRMYLQLVTVVILCSGITLMLRSRKL
jgi:hypothetical protein